MTFRRAVSGTVDPEVWVFNKHRCTQTELHTKTNNQQGFGEYFSTFSSSGIRFVALINNCHPIINPVSIHCAAHRLTVRTFTYWSVSCIVWHTVDLQALFYSHWVSEFRGSLEQRGSYRRAGSQTINCPCGLVYPEIPQHGIPPHLNWNGAADRLKGSRLSLSL